MKETFLFLLFATTTSIISAQNFYFGADQSYVNEMEDCGVIYKEKGAAKDVYQIYKDHGSNLVRLRLWHNPKWYDELNDGKRYSDLNDVKKAIARAKAHNMEVLLDFHLSDNWADPSKQLVPEAWLPIVDNLPLLKDSLYSYITEVLTSLDEEDLLPEMVQIGNETNKGILLSPEDNAVWTLDWERNAGLFNEGIRAVRDFDQDIKIMIHAAGPDNTGWLMEQFHANGVTDFDIIGISYYWAWHKPMTINGTGKVIREMIEKYNKEVIIAETGYIWTTASNDQANNIISDIDPSYGAASPESQKQWLIDLTTEVIKAGGSGVIYWEPSWVSSSCYTQWGQGSHQEHASFFDFDNNLLEPGGIEWMSYDYGIPSSTSKAETQEIVEIKYLNGSILIEIGGFVKDYDYSFIDTLGRSFQKGKLMSGSSVIALKVNAPKLLFVKISDGNRIIKTEKVITN